ncbi:HTH-type transcriptional regulator ArgP [Pseudomonas koreensis]|uniref:HTH-type transcriptional regulator ArgP n=1 Tax=Pseudomonas koreensis TaxID=198620 RepID=UPI0020779936|nr:HTH-type transcriptional regulator ArgP [Pseudomonas koreensis]MCM8741575.1 HTH-type transcriptional regulator ArgP [Pseudomonas koreensis]
MQLDAKQMQAFLAVVDSGSFEKAAERLNVTPSAVSQRIHALEVRLGSSVVVRGRPCEPTLAGRKLMLYLRRATVLEEELLNELTGDEQDHLRVVIAVNGDTLATWFFPALAEIFVSENILLDVVVDDQDHTYALLESGQVIGCIGTRSQPMRGCFAELLGSMRYQLVASPEFQQRWFAKGLTRAAARKAPVFAYSRKDTLQSDFMQSRFGLPADAYPTHYLSLPEARLKAIRRGLGYGMVPYMQVSDLLKSRELVDVAPGHFTDVELYWHAWALQSPRMELLSDRAVHAARRMLSSKGPTKRSTMPKK